MGYLSDILWRFEKKIVRIHFVFKETYGAIADRVFRTSAPICTGTVYLPMNMIFLSLFNGVGSLDTSYWYDRQRQVLRINAIPSLQYVIKFDWCWIPTALPYSKKDWVQICKGALSKTRYWITWSWHQCGNSIIKHLNCVLISSWILFCPWGFTLI